MGVHNVGDLNRSQSVQSKTIVLKPNKRTFFFFFFF
jgi:hypothetical protein